MNRLLLGRRSFLALGGGALGGVALGAGAEPATDPPRFFRIATGAATGTYFQLGGLIASAISKPPGTPSCDKGGSCGVPGLIAVAEASSGAVDNIDLLRSGGAEAAFVQSDAALWAFGGTGAFAGRPPFVELRSLGALYTEALHLVVPRESSIRTPGDLAGRALSVGEAASGTWADVAVVLDAYGLSNAIAPRHLKLGAAAEQLAAGTIDGFFIVGGAPLPAVAELATRAPVRLVPFADARAAELTREGRFFRPAIIAAGVYKDVAETATLGVTAELMTTTALDDALIKAVLEALWNDHSRQLLAAGHPLGRQMTPEFAATHPAVPLHPGAAAFYRAMGIDVTATP